MLSNDKWLKLKISETTEIVLQSGAAYAGELTDRNLVVLYDIVTKSIPAQTSPLKIVVLPETNSSELPNDVSSMDIMVDDKKIDTHAAYTNKAGVVMVPLRAIAEALKFAVSWDNELQAVKLGKSISLTIGKDNYSYLKTAPIQLGVAPELRDGNTFVPLSFFKRVAQMNNAYVFEGQIVINNGEKME